MIYISKGTEPRSLTEYRNQPNSTYEDYREKDDVRRQLLEEQGHICAYCMRRISIDKMKIEHWKAQNAEDGTGKEHMLEYRNMLGVCLGNQGNIYSKQTCDSHRGNAELFVDPRNESHIQKIQYSADGKICSSDLRIRNDLSSLLNLNEQMLIDGRKRAIQMLQNYLMKKNPKGTWNVSLLRNAQKQFAEKKDGMYPQYVGAVLYFIERYLKKAK